MDRRHCCYKFDNYLLPKLSAFPYRSLLIVTKPWPKTGRCPTLIHLNEGNLTVRPRGYSFHHIFDFKISE